MFWETLCKLCDERGIKPNTVCRELGFSTATATHWKNGKVPKSDKLKMLADYFGVSADYFLGNNESKPDARKAEAVTDEDLKFALFNGTDGITDAMYEEVKQFAQMVKMREEAKNKGE